MHYAASYIFMLELVIFYVTTIPFVLISGDLILSQQNIRKTFIIKHPKLNNLDLETGFGLLMNDHVEQINKYFPCYIHNIE